MEISAFDIINLLTDGVIDRKEARGYLRDQNLAFRAVLEGSSTACELQSSVEEGNSLSTDGVLCSELFEALLGSYSLTVTETQQLADLIARLSSLDRSLVASILSGSEVSANA